MLTVAPSIDAVQPRRHARRGGGLRPAAARQQSHDYRSIVERMPRPVGVVSSGEIQPYFRALLHRGELECPRHSGTERMIPTFQKSGAAV